MSKAPKYMHDMLDEMFEQAEECRKGEAPYSTILTRRCTVAGYVNPLVVKIEYRQEWGDERPRYE